MEVIEIIPPAVDTDLGGPGLHTFGVPVGEFVDAVAQRLEKGEIEIGYDFAEKARRASRAELDEMFARMNRLVHQAYLGNRGAKEVQGA